MTLLSRALNVIARAAPDRPPASMSGGSGFMLEGASGGSSSSAVANLQAYSATGWLFAVVQRISTAVASAEWKLYTVRSNGDRTQVRNHPLLDIWESANPFSTRDDFVETFQQHLELTGEAYWLLVGGPMRPEELWPLRPDRMKPIPDRANWLRGWEYTVNSGRIFLEPEWVVQLRSPSPMDPYRGIGPVGSVRTDLETERSAAEWSRSFFRNSAEPGGVLQFDDNLSDADFEKLVMRWQAQHQGSSNAHRVAVIEKGKWVDRKITQRDMQFEQLRHLNRDLILGAFGMHASIMGIAENVNRANAEAAEVHFGRWLVRPRLRRIRRALNERVAPFFGANLEFDFTDPVPDDRELDLREATEGYTAGFLTLNEARRRLEESEVDGGDEFRAIGMSPLMLDVSGSPYRLRSADDADIRPTEVNSSEDRMSLAWARRLTAELEAIVLFLTPFFARRVRVNPRRATEKIEIGDIDTFDWDWYGRYGDEVAGELSTAFGVAMVAEFPGMPPERLQLLASLWARERAGDLLRLDGSLSLAATTRARVRELVGNAIESGEPLGTLQKRLRDDPVFSRERAARVARTETAVALGQGQKGAALEQGRDEKRWMTQGDVLVRPAHVENASAGWISISAAFPSGQDTIGNGPASLVVNCRCTVIYRTAPVQDSISEFRCPEDGLLLGRDVAPGEARYCRRCKQEHSAPLLTTHIT